MRLDDLPTPALLLDVEVLEANLRRMADRTRELGVTLRPHIKTHKCIEIAERQRALGATGITVSTLYEAGVFADHGFVDITWAFPLIPSRIAELEAVCKKARTGVVVDSLPAVEALSGLRFPARVWLKVDCGYHRAGVDPAGPYAETVVRAIAEEPGMEFAGILSHSGHAYAARSTAEIRAISEGERRVMTTLADRLRRAGFKVPEVSVGSTPSMAQVTDLTGVTEVRPGNYAFYDRAQVVLGSCSYRDCAVTVLATVVSSQPGAAHCVIDAGALALSKDPGPDAEPRSMGELYEEYAAGRLAADARVVSLSQEHGIVAGRYPVGTRLRVLPNHSCLTVANFDTYWLVRGTEVTGRWRIWSGRERAAASPEK